jgi:hypothetical protein
MSEPDVSGGAPAGARQAPKRAPARLQDLVLLVTVPSRPDAVRAYTEAESTEAEAYAAATGGAVNHLER